MHDFPRPRVLISACLLGDKVRYDGNSATDEFALLMSGFVEAVKLCPEMELGLGSPRPKIILYEEDSEVFAFQKETGRFLTEDLRSLAGSVLKNLGPIDGALLKSRSPSCGVSGTKVFADKLGNVLRRRGRGIFAEGIISRLADIPVEDEERLRRHRTLRIRFLMGILTSACIREGSWNELAKLIENRTSRKMNLKTLKTFYKRAQVKEVATVLEKIFGTVTLSKLVEA